MPAAPRHFHADFMLLRRTVDTGMDSGYTTAPMATQPQQRAFGHDHVTSSKRTINPEIARRILDGARDFINRDVKEWRVDQYAADMAAGNWMQNGETLVFDDAGVLIDGQHRMLAVIKSGATITFLCSNGVSRAAARTIDQGLSRSVVSAMQMGGMKSAAATVAAARSLHELRGAVDPLCDTGKRHNSEFSLRTVAEVDLFLERAAPGLYETLACMPGGAAKAMALSELAAVTYELALVESQAMALEWATGMAGGLPLEDPRGMLREKLIANKLAARSRDKVGLSRAERMSMMIQSWNLWAGGHKTRSGNSLNTSRGESSPYAIVIPVPARVARANQIDMVNRTARRNIRGL